MRMVSPRRSPPAYCALARVRGVARGGVGHGVRRPSPSAKRSIMAKYITVSRQSKAVTSPQEAAAPPQTLITLFGPPCRRGSGGVLGSAIQRVPSMMNLYSWRPAGLDAGGDGPGAVGASRERERARGGGGGPAQPRAAQPDAGGAVVDVAELHLVAGRGRRGRRGVGAEHGAVGEHGGGAGPVGQAGGVVGAGAVGGGGDGAAGDVEVGADVGERGAAVEEARVVDRAARGERGGEDERAGPPGEGVGHRVAAERTRWGGGAESRGGCERRGRRGRRRGVGWD
jgi:hypothetical protein